LIAAECGRDVNLTPTSNRFLAHVEIATWCAVGFANGFANCVGSRELVGNELLGITP
jgi:hypothetical protein